MADIKTIWNPDSGTADWQLASYGLLTGDDLETAIIISFFTDRVAGQDDPLPVGGDPRGWCLDDPKYPIGSRMWLLRRAKQIPETAGRARDYLIESVQWLIDDGVVSRFDIKTAWVGAGRLGAAVVAYRHDGSSVALNFGWVWGE